MIVDSPSCLLLLHVNPCLVIKCRSHFDFTAENYMSSSIYVLLLLLFTP